MSPHCITGAEEMAEMAICHKRLPLWEECIRREYHLLLTKTLIDKMTFESSAFHEKSLKAYHKILKILWITAEPYISELEWLFGVCAAFHRGSAEGRQDTMKIWDPVIWGYFTSGWWLRQRYEQYIFYISI